MAKLPPETTATIESSSSFKQISNLQLRIAEAQPFATLDILNLLDRVISRTQNRIPALERSIEEIKLEWNLS